MKVVLGHKILNLEELFSTSSLEEVNSKNTLVEVAIDAQIYAELAKQANKEQPKSVFDRQTEYAKETLSRQEVRGVLLVKIVQLLKLKQNC